MSWAWLYLVVLAAKDVGGNRPLKFTFWFLYCFCFEMVSLCSPCFRSASPCLLELGLKEQILLL